MRPRLARISAQLAARARQSDELRRHVLLAQIRYTAWRQGATVHADIAPGVRVGHRIAIEVGPRSETSLTIGPGCRLGDDIRFRLRGGSIRLGRDVDVRAHAVLNVGGGNLVLEGPNNISWGVVIHCAESVHLARFAHVAEYSTIVDSTHFYTSPDEWSYHNTRTRPVSLGEDVWVCPKSTIASGVTIGDHTIVGSNTVVTQSVPAGVLVSGVPAEIVKKLDLPWEREAAKASLR